MTEKQKEVEKEKEKQKHRCIKCGSLFGYLRIKEKAWVCRICGNVDNKVVI